MHRNNFIVGQVTPDMLKAMPYGTYILFGLLTYIGAAFIWFFVPETKRLTLEEMVRFKRKRSHARIILILTRIQDVIFGSEGTAQADFERMEEINHEIGLTQMLRGSSHGAGSDIDNFEKEKIEDHSEKVG